MQRLGGLAPALQRLHQLIDIDPGAAEHQRRRRLLHLQHPQQRRQPELARHQVRRLTHPRRRALLDLALDAHPLGVVQVALGDLGDGVRQGGREQRRLARRRRRHLIEDRLQVVGEAHVEHLVGLVEHDLLHRAQLQRLTA